MHDIKYDIKLNNDGRLCIDLPPEYEDKPEDKFFAIEITRYVLQDIFSRRNAEFDPKTVKNMQICFNVLGQLGDEVAAILKENMKIVGDATVILNRKKAHITVQTIEERNSLPSSNIFYDGVIYQRREGLRIFVQQENKQYELKDGIDNENWSEVV